MTRKRSPTKEVEVVLLEETLSGVELRAYTDRRNAVISLTIDHKGGQPSTIIISPAMIAQWDKVVQFVNNAISCLTPPRRFDKTSIEKPIISEVGDQFPLVKPIMYNEKCEE